MSSEAKPHPFVLRQKLEDFADWLFPIVDRFPKREKWALCTEIKRCVYRLIHRTIRLQKSRQKLKEIFELDIELELLRSLIRRAYSARYISGRRLKLITERIAEIGRILGGMMKRQQGARS